MLFDRLIRARIARIRERLASERGFSLVELLLTTAMLTVVLGAVIGFLVTSRRVAVRDYETGIVQNQSEIGYARMLREIRQATCINLLDVARPSAALVPTNCPGALRGAAVTNPI